MYLLFRYHDWDPEFYLSKGRWWKRIIKVFMNQQMEDMSKEHKNMWGGGTL